MTRDERRADRWTDGRARGGFERTVYETLTMYERSFPAIGERFFKRSAWPTPEEVSAHANGDATFKMLYGEMYYRHLHQATTPTAEERRGAWENYAAVFEALATGEANMQLPNLWLYDMVDEFVYQYQSFAQFKGEPEAHAGGGERDQSARRQGLGSSGRGGSIEVVGGEKRHRAGARARACG